jgi:hypothetical protein
MDASTGEEAGSKETELVGIVRPNATIDRDKKEQAQASLLRHIRRLLTRYK